MKRYAFIAGVICLSGTFVTAQESGAPAVEVGVNYSFVHVTSPQGLGSYGENGGSASFAYNVNRTLGLVGDLGGYDSGNLGVHTFSYMVGPRLNWRMSRVVPYVQFLFGGIHEWGFANSDGTSSTPNAFATAAGGGVDINITRHIALKPFQLEYFMTQLPNSVSTPNSVQNNLRYSAGLVFNFGAK